MTNLDLTKHKLKILQADLATETRSSEKLRLGYEISELKKIIKSLNK